MDEVPSVNGNILHILLLSTIMCFSGIRGQTYSEASIVFPDGSTARNGTLFKIECDFTPNVFPKMVIFQARDVYGNPSNVFSYVTEDNGRVLESVKDSFKGRAFLTPSRQKFLLEINPILLEDAGNYGCQVFKDFSDQITAYRRRLYVNAIPSKPVMRISGSGVSRLGLNVRIICVANTGKPAGHLIWSRKYHKDGGFLPINGDGVSSQMVNGTVVETEDYVIHHLREEDDHSIYKCEARNDELRPSEERPTATLTIRVEYPVKDIKILPTRRVYRSGQSIHCRARGNPTPIYRWTKENGTGALLIDEETLKIEDTTIGGQYSYKCTALNYVDHYPHSVDQSISLYVKGPPMLPSNFRINDVTATSVLISWTSSFDGGENQTFSLQSKKIGQSWPITDTYTDIPDTGEGEKIEHKVFNLKPQGIYQFRVRACNPLCTGYSDYITGTTKAAPQINVEDIKSMRTDEFVSVRWKKVDAQGATFKIKYCTSSSNKCFYHIVADSSATSTAILVGDVQGDITIYFEVLVEGDVVFSSPALPVKEPVVTVPVSTINATSSLTSPSEEVKVVNANTGIIVATVVGLFAMVSIGVAVVWFLPKSMRNKMVARLRHMRRADRNRGPPRVITVNCNSETPIPTMPPSATVSDHGDGDRSTLEKEPIGKSDHNLDVTSDDDLLNKTDSSKDWRTSSDLHSKSEHDSLMESEGYGESEP